MFEVGVCMEPCMLNVTMGGGEGLEHSILVV